MGPASAYAAVLKTIDRQLESLLTTSPHIFAFDTVEQGVLDIRDFGTTGVVAFAKGQGFLPSYIHKKDNPLIKWTPTN